MKKTVSNRHEGDLGGTFLPFGDVDHVDVTVVVDPNSPERLNVQHTAWMLVNLLVRLDKVVRKVFIVCPRHVPLAGRVVPLAPRNVDLRTALIAGAQAIGVVPVEPAEVFTRTIFVGLGDGWPHPVDLRALGNGWCGGISSSPIPHDSLGENSPLPFGPYIAACLAAGEVFKAARMKPEFYIAPRSAFYSLWQHRSAPLPIVGGPELVQIALDTVLAGVGAVGSAFVHNIWACTGLRGQVLLVDNDKDGVDETNLNRYVIFGNESVGKPKATEAARVAFDADVSWHPKDAAIETLASVPARVVSAVDKNWSRQAIQNRYPARIFSASTLDLRAEVLRCGPPGIGACLRCYNPPETLPSDNELRGRLLLEPDNCLAERAQAVGISLQEAKEWAHSGKCGVAGERLLPQLRLTAEQMLFAVGFVSVMAGTMVAATLLKDHLKSDEPLSDSIQRATFQFHSPLAHSNRASAFGRDPTCPMCNPATIACQTWATRFRGPHPQAQDAWV